MWLADEQERWLLWAPVAIGLGVYLYFAATDEPALLTALGPPVLAAIGLATMWRRPALRFPALLLLLCAIGYAAGAVRTHSVDAPVIGRKIGPVTVTGHVLAVDPRQHGVRIVLDDLTIGRLSAADTPARVRLTVRVGAATLRPGQVVTMRAVLLPVRPPVAPGAADFQRRAYFERIGASGFVITAPAVVEVGGGGWFGAWIEQARDTAMRRIAAVVPGDAGGVAVALLTGHRGGISPEAMAAIRNAGLAHLLAISGLHIGMVAGIVFFVLVVRARIGTGGGPALADPEDRGARRAGGGGGLPAADRRNDPDPARLPDAGGGDGRRPDRPRGDFDAAGRGGGHGSVAAVAGKPAHAKFPDVLRRGRGAGCGLRSLVALAIAQAQAPRLPRPVRALVGVGATSLIAGAATGPFALYHFQRLAIYGLAANLAAVPIVSFFVLPMGLLALFAMPFGLEAGPLWLMAQGIHLMLWVAHGVSGLPGALALAPAPLAWGMAMIVAGGLWLAIWQRPWRVAGVAVIALGLASSLFAARPDILISPEGRLVATRTADGALAVSSARRGRFIAKVWREGEAQRQPRFWHSDRLSRVRCDTLGCIYRLDGRLIAFPADPAALAEDCGRALMIVADFDVRQHCPAVPWTVDRRALARNGSHTIHFAGGRVTHSNRPGRARRPALGQPPALAGPPLEAGAAAGRGGFGAVGNLPIPLAAVRR